MPETDTFALARLAAGRARSPRIRFQDFVSFAQKYARRYIDEKPELARYLVDTERFIASELEELESAGRVSIERVDAAIESFDVPQFWADLVFQEYKKLDESVELPFPDDESVGIPIPAECIKALSLELDFSAALDPERQNGALLYRITFPEGVKSLVIPKALVPEKLLEYSLLKIRHYLRGQNNKEYILHKLMVAFQNKEMSLKDALNGILVKPYDALAQLKEPTDFGFSLWSYMCGYIKADYQKKKDKLPEDWGVLQAAHLMDFFNNYFKSKSQREQSAQAAFKALDSCLAKPPYYFAMEDIERFVDSTGVPLLGKYDKEGLREYLGKRLTSSDKSSLPPLLSFRIGNDRRYYVLKDKVVALCVRRVGEARSKIRKEMIEAWKSLLSNYERVPSMDEDEAFNEELKRRLSEADPVLSALLNFDLLALVFDEVEGKERDEAQRFLRNEELAPMSSILSLGRKELLTDVKILLPFWQTVPVLRGIMAFFSRLGARRKKAQERKKAATRERDAADEMAVAPDAAQPSQKEHRTREIRQAVAIIEKSLIPSGSSLDEYLSELCGRWNTLLSKEAMDNLTEDVNSLARDFLRRMLRHTRPSSLTLERLESLSDTLVESPSLSKIKNRGALHSYLLAYMLKLLKKI
jgi:hypothetical protein